MDLIQGQLGQTDTCFKIFVISLLLSISRKDVNHGILNLVDLF